MQASLEALPISFMNQRSRRNVIAFILSACLILLLLLIPVSFNHHATKPEKLIQLDFSKPIVAVKKAVANKVTKNVQSNKTVKAPEKVDKPKVTKGTIKKNVLKKKAITPTKKILVTKKNTKVVNKAKEAPLPHVGAIYSSIENRKPVVIVGSEFKELKPTAKDFKFRKFEKADIYKVTKLINEEIDKPQYEMNFYAEGIEGSVERFMDKITYKKSFTTKYGTKIECAAVAIVMVVCGWK